MVVFKVNEIRFMPVDQDSVSDLGEMLSQVGTYAEEGKAMMSVNEHVQVGDELDGEWMRTTVEGWARDLGDQQMYESRHAGKGLDEVISAREASIKAAQVMRVTSCVVVKRKWLRDLLHLELHLIVYSAL